MTASQGGLEEEEEEESPYYLKDLLRPPLEEGEKNLSLAAPEVGAREKQLIRKEEKKAKPSGLLGRLKKEEPAEMNGHLKRRPKQERRLEKPHQQQEEELQERESPKTPPMVVQRQKPEEQMGRLPEKRSWNSDCLQRKTPASRTNGTFSLRPTASRQNLSRLYLADTSRHLSPPYESYCSYLQEVLAYCPLKLFYLNQQGPH